MKLYTFLYIQKQTDSAVKWTKIGFFINNFLISTSYYISSDADVMKDKYRRMISGVYIDQLRPQILNKCSFLFH